jgi:hypothetical protein
VVPLLEALEGASISYVIGGSFASGAWGYPRHTNDLDIVVSLDLDSGKRLSTRLSSDFVFDVWSLDLALESEDEYRSVQIFHLPTMFKFDLFIPVATDEFMGSVLARRMRAELFPSFFGYLYSSEDIVLQKLRWFILGNQISDKQWNDIIQVLEIQANQIDRSYLNHWAKRFGFTELLNTALQESSLGA